MRRSVLTAITLLSIYGAYRVYAAVVRPLVKVAEVPSVDLHGAAPSDSIRSSLQEEIADRHLSHEPWARRAPYFWQRSEDQRSEEAFLFFEEWLRIEDDLQNKLRVSPFAVVWYDRDRDGGVPYVMTAASALVEFESRIELSEEEPGRIVRADLEGQVRITGPDRLELAGREFTFDEAEGRLYSAHPVKFAYGPAADSAEQVKGRADQFDVLFDQTDEPIHGEEMPLIGGLARVLLRRNVHMELTLAEDDRPTHVTIDSDGQFTFNVRDRLATFDDNVRIVRPTHASGEPPAFDRLSCQFVSLAFAEQAGANGRPRAEPNQAGLNLHLRLQQIRAVGDRVWLQSDEHRLRARMHELHYDLDGRTISLSDDEAVEVIRESDLLVCPFVTLVHDEEDQIRAAECRGPGKVQHLGPHTAEVEFELSWEREMHLRPDPDTSWDVLILEGEATALQPLQRIGTAADFLKVWIDREAAVRRLDSSDTAALTSDSAEVLPIKRVLAERDVVVVSPQVQVKAEHLEADVASTTSGIVPAGRQSRQPTRSDDRPLVGGTDQGAAAADPPLIEAERITAHILHNPLSDDTILAEVRATHNVTVRRAADSKQSATDRDAPHALSGPFDVQADDLLLTESEDGRQVLTLEGAPCRIRHSQGQIEGNNIQLDRQGNRAEVQGRGSLTMTVSQDLEGNPLDEPKLLTVQWTEKMTFDGERIDFLGDVRTRLETSLMQCEEMVLLLTRRLSFAEDRPDAEDVEIREVHCRHHVEAVYFSWGAGSIVTGKRKASVAEFSTNLQTGEFRARGPGRIENWQRGTSLRVSLAPEAVASANQPAESDKFDWEYVRIAFAGEMMGNHSERRATLHDRVEVMYGPVNDGIETINRDELFELSRETEQSKNSVWMGSDQLQILLQPDGDSDSDGSLQVVAWGNAELEGQRFRARSHSISYDESKELFILRGRGSNASIWHWNRPEAVPAPSKARVIELVPSRMELKMDGVTRIWGVQ